MSQRKGSPGHWLGAMVFMVCSLFATPAMAATQIHDVFADRENNTLFIEGQGFTKGLLRGNTPYIELGGMPLVLKSGYSDSHLEATLPNALADGEYQIFVSRSGIQKADSHLLKVFTSGYTATYSLSLLSPGGGRRATRVTKEILAI